MSKISWPYRAAFSAILVPCTLGGCVSLPKFHGSNVDMPAPQIGVPKVSDVTRHIQCELINLLNNDSQDFAGLKARRYVVFAQLTIEVTDDNGLNPSVSFIEPFSVASTKRSIGLGAQLQGKSHRLFNQTFTLDLDPDRINQNASCNQSTGSAGIQGSLGIDQIVAEGLRSTSDAAFILPLVNKDRDFGVVSKSEIPTFGTTIDFTLISGVTVDPVWTLTKFTGPGGSKLLNAMRTVKDTLILTFASVPLKTDAAEAAADPSLKFLDQEEAAQALAERDRENLSAAAEAAETAASRLILQRILP